MPGLRLRSRYLEAAELMHNQAGPLPLSLPPPTCPCPLFVPPCPSVFSPSPSPAPVTHGQDVSWQGKPACLIVNDIDAGLGRHTCAQMTVNNQIVQVRDPRTCQARCSS